MFVISVFRDCLVTRVDNRSMKIFVSRNSDDTVNFPVSIRLDRKVNQIYDNRVNLSLMF